MVTQQTTVDTEKLDIKSVAKRVRERAEASPVFSNICYVFALRQRTRRQVTIHSLSITMQKEGFMFTRAQYMKELEFLASLGLGVLQRSKTGVIRALKEINVTLQSIGLVGVGKKTALDRAYFVNRVRNYKPLPKPSATRETVDKINGGKVADKATLILNIEGRRLALQLEPKLTSEELLNLIFKIAAVGVENER